MSRVGKKPIPLNSKVKAVLDSKTKVLNISGPLGELSMVIPTNINLDITESEVLVTVDNPKQKSQKALWGTIRAIINNMVQGVLEGFTKEVELNGVGYRMELGKELMLHIGYSHPVIVQIPSSIKLTLKKNLLSGTSIDKQALGNFFSYIHNLKPCDPYKHKGFKFPGRFYIKKEGKKGK